MIEKDLKEKLEKLNIKIGTYAGGISVAFVGPNVRLLYKSKEKKVEALQIINKRGFGREGGGLVYGKKWKGLFEKADRICQDLTILLAGPDSATIEPVHNPYRNFNRVLDTYLT